VEQWIHDTTKRKEEVESPSSFREKPRNPRVKREINKRRDEKH
jgi:hypothetical protein